MQILKFYDIIIMKAILFFTRSEKMKENYVSAQIEFILLDDCDVFTMSGPIGGDPITGGGPIGGGGYDPSGWT